MKQKNIFMTAILAALLVLVLNLAGCDTGGGGGGGGDPLFSFTGAVKGTDIKFRLTTAETTSRFIRATVTSSSYAISGALNTGTAVITLSGTYDPGDYSFTLSGADSDGNIYTFFGAFDPETGKMVGSIIATVGDKEDGELETHQVESSSGDFSNSVASTASGIPNDLKGFWNILSEKKDIDQTDEGWVLFSDWSAIFDFVLIFEKGSDVIKYFNIGKATIVYVDANSDGSFDVIVGYPGYNLTDVQIETVLKEFLSERGLSTSITQISGDSGGKSGWMIDGRSIEWFNIPDDVLPTIQQFYTGNYLENHYLTIATDPLGSKYQKQNFKRVGNTWEMITRGTKVQDVENEQGYSYKETFDSLEEAKAADTLLTADLDDSYAAVIFSR